MGSDLDKLAKGLRELWCEWTHSGGKIERDELGRINWRCSRCKRWGGYPVPLRDEGLALKAHIERTTHA